MARSAYVELVLTLERDLQTLNDKSIVEQSKHLRAQYDDVDKKWLREEYSRRTFHRAINEVLGIARKARQRRQDRKADLFVGGAQ